MARSLTAPLQSCHGRWCYLTPNSTQCQDVTTFLNQSYPDPLFYMLKACCEIYCDQNKTNSNPLLALQCQGATTSAAISIWASVVVVVVLAFLHLLGGMLPGGTQKYTTMGSLAVKTGLASYFLVTFSDQNVDTILYPIVAAMDFAIFCYFFSGFQYSIGIGFEAASVILLTYTVFPLYRILSVPKLTVPNLVDDTMSSDPHEHLPRVEALLMLALALLWALHSAIYRTISYRAHWIEAWKNQKKQPTGDAANAHMSRLWFLAAGHGHPTWHTPLGRNVGLLMLILCWIIVVQCNMFLKKTCTDDFVLFRIMLYVPPTLLTLAILSTEIYLLRFAHEPWHNLKKFILLQGPSSADFLEATVAYRLGRNTLFVENLAEDKTRLDLLKGTFDTSLGHTVFYLEYGLHVLFYIPIAITAGFNFCLLCSLRRLNIEWFKHKLRLAFNQLGFEETQINHAYKILIKYSGVDGMPTEAQETIPQKTDFIQKMLIRQQKYINLPLLLDEIGPSALMYLLKILDQALTPLMERELSSQHNNMYI